ncbi:MAG: 50S ribosomal protein L2 [Parcubacteria group bacterium CG08_land_8_20_14_0_20_48_21]|nr:MAG: 50S ribosomal protein L2 [Parcubacteria group bacterium CG2_30_48_51]PIS32627.1 MAG: 50S ribosomal protein L2 [Parcubacteria group bacterium CG08_land_8_20_14_0_20_48_21]PIW79290.1 MAG: 50S ribosomal protein L2 [Parcubacteria group bacterium CG_4_8_14_3_um_filter_48_16]PIY77591.1 MAG: 50S ribosomal protein L2 [Parcubacteria group bacterium CG_4_10_14_0_8_um_filter_48_154]PIZ77176.1 MAG: 50S ribosomal protein L2 [bacterium CG_4_10_14_0_2_um_filter_48_144]PJC40130.1 MAG: 50S ribosomal pr
MAIHIYKPTTPARRKTSVDKATDTTKGAKPHKPLLVALPKKSGRNNQGKITIRHRGGGAKRNYRIVDFKQQKFSIPGKIVSVEYDPNRNARIMLVVYRDGEKAYALAYEGAKAGAPVLSAKEKIAPKTGNRMPLAFIPVGLPVHNVELTQGRGGAIVRSAGTSAQLMGVEGKFALLKLPSGEVRQVYKECLATIGVVSNPEYKNIRWGKAGRTRLRGVRPTVRGKAMNPVDHPHGGGEGSNPIGLKGPKTPWGKYALGVRTRKKKKYSHRYILQRRKTKKKR